MEFLVRSENRLPPEFPAERRAELRSAERARERGWPVHELDTGHEAMVTAPKALADVLLDLAR